MIEVEILNKIIHFFCNQKCIFCELIVNSMNILVYLLCTA